MIEEVKITLSPEEALVLFEILSRFEESGRLEALDPAEARALWNAQATLESTLTAPLDDKYRELLRRAKLNLMGFTPANAVIVIKYGLDPDSSGFTHREVCDWCDRFCRAYYDAECPPEIEKILPILSGIDAQWEELYLANTYDLGALKSLDLDQVELPREWFQEWIRRLEECS
ncbi:MAG: hypothetical protein KJ626_15335 [Verrucomicrobia bacterium]|nr:hypothetical protein [Verrucomicrobiota bacterium]